MASLIVLSILGVLAVGIAALLATPVRAHVEFDTEAEPRRLRWRVRWMAMAFGSDRPRRKAAPKRDEQRRRKKPRARGGGPRVRAALTTPGMARRGACLVRELAAVLRPRELEAVVRIGLDDPAGTGMIFGRIMALAALSPADWRVRVEPVFEEPVLATRGSASWSVSPASLLWPVARFLSAPPVWRAAWVAWRTPSTKRPL